LVQVFNKKIWWQGSKISFIGLGDICTLAQFRNQGYASALIKYIINKKGLSLMGLFSKIPQYYKKFGFSIVPRERIVIKKSSWLPSKIKAARIRSFNFKDDILKVMAIHRSYFRHFIGPVARQFGDWQAQFSYFNEEKKLFLVLEIAGKISAYIRCKWSRVFERRLEIVEYAAADIEEDFIRFFISYLFSRYDIEEISALTIFFKNGLASKRKVTREIDSLMMVRVPQRRGYLLSKLNQICFLEADSF
jgi:predicted acetyltransferase